MVKPTAQCVPLNQYGKIAIVDFKTDRTITTEEWSTPQIVRNSSRLITEHLKDRLNDLKKFNEVVVTDECPQGAMKIVGEINTFYHNKRRFHASVKGDFVDCKTGVSLYKFDWDEPAKTIANLPQRIAIRLSVAVDKQFICEKKP